MQQTPYSSILPVRQLRQDTPGTAHNNHLNNAGAALPPRPVIDAMQGYLQLEAKIGGYEAAALIKEEKTAFYEAVAQLLNTQPSQVAFAGSATLAYNTALSSVPFREGDVILTTDDDYVSNQIAFLQLGKRFGTQLVRADSLPQGGAAPESVRRLVQQHHPKLVAVTHIPTNSGLVQEVEAIGHICREAGVWYLVDACQSAGQLPLDVAKIGCDFLTATSRKFLRGPRGGGFLYTSERALQAGLEPLYMDLHGARWLSSKTYEPRPGAVRYETFECSYAVMLGLRAAVEYALGLGMGRITERVQHLSRQLRETLAQRGLQPLDRGTQKAGIVTVAVPGWKPAALIAELRSRNINASVASQNSALIDFTQKGVEWALRLSPHYYNTEEEVEQAAATLQELHANGPA